ncbi:hypothetical protein VSR01_08700 [Actinacidiphila sp. DG2A-62]|uniref:hypothetical protein n=1 Tax=Actinacidiphila sp. DG2A-62 TaxID=3108821 RepID=UPI002DC03B4A|nr:hypothetical protein [Actinacidiphila sp. DG2A-62]MEC3993611.1 hypothetical protein [Actinacidiphila sp. DG2A-62]
MRTGTYARLHAEIVSTRLEREPLPARLHRTLRAVSGEMSLLRAGTLVWPSMTEDAYHRYGRVLAAQLAELAVRGHLWLSYGRDLPGPAGLEVARHSGAPPPAREEEAMLMRVVLGGEDSVRLASRTDGQAWDRLAATLHKALKDDGLGWSRLDRYRTWKILLTLRRWMAEYARREPAWRTDPALHLAGSPYAVLFGIENGSMSWPHPPEEVVYLPSLLPQACDMAVNGTGRSAW